MPQRSDQTAELERFGMIRAHACAQTLYALTEDARVFARIDRKPMLVIPDTEFATLFFERELQLALLERDSILVAEHRNQHSAAERRLRRPPVDIEELGVRGSGAVFEHIEPPLIV